MTVESIIVVLSLMVSLFLVFVFAGLKKRVDELENLVMIIAIGIVEMGKTQDEHP